MLGLQGFRRCPLRQRVADCPNERPLRPKQWPDGLDNGTRHLLPSHDRCPMASCLPPEPRVAQSDGDVWAFVVLLPMLWVWGHRQLCLQLCQHACWLYAVAQEAWIVSGVLWVSAVQQARGPPSCLVCVLSAVCATSGKTGVVGSCLACMWGICRLPVASAPGGGTGIPPACRQCHTLSVCQLAQCAFLHSRSASCYVCPSCSRLLEPTARVSLRVFGVLLMLPCLS